MCPHAGEEWHETACENIVQAVEDGATRNYAQKDEGKTWRRVAPAIG